MLIIEDEPAILRFLRDPLEEDGWQIFQARSGELGIRLAAMQKPDLVLLDISFGNGMDILRALHQWVTVPLIVLTGRNQDGIDAINEGADDYLVKPFDVAELTTRLKLAMRHTEGWPGKGLPVYEHHGLQIDLLAHRVRVNNIEIHLSPMEYRFLAVLVRNTGRIVLWRQLADAVWDENHKVKPEDLRVIVHQLRQKIESDPSKPRLLITEPRVGYKLESPRLRRSSHSSIAKSPNKHLTAHE